MAINQADKLKCHKRGENSKKFKELKKNRLHYKK